MKMVTILIGLAIFSIVTTMMFSAVNQILVDSSSTQDASEWDALSGEYEQFTQSVSPEGNSTLRSISGQTESGEADSTERSVFLFSGAISGGKLLTNFFLNIKDVQNKVTGDTDQFVDSRIINAVVIILFIVIVLSTLFFLRGAKAET